MLQWEGALEAHQHLSDPTGPVAETNEPEPEIGVPDTSDISEMLHLIHSTDDAEFKNKTAMIPFIILS